MGVKTSPLIPAFDSARLYIILLIMLFVFYFETNVWARGHPWRTPGPAQLLFGEVHNAATRYSGKTQLLVSKWLFWIAPDWRGNYFSALCRVYLSWKVDYKTFEPWHSFTAVQIFFCSKHPFRSRNQRKTRKDAISASHAWGRLMRNLPKLTRDPIAILSLLKSQ